MLTCNQAASKSYSRVCDTAQSVLNCTDISTSGPVSLIFQPIFGGGQAQICFTLLKAFGGPHVHNELFDTDKFGDCRAWNFFAGVNI